MITEEKPKIATLFWFYKEPDICKNRLELFRKYNPDTAIYGLYGGPQEDLVFWEKELGEYLDDIYMIPSDDKDYKWQHGDLTILDWFENRGNSFDWDSIFIFQWDLLVFENIEKIFPGMKKDEVFFSGSRTLTKDVEDKWDWTSGEDQIARKDYEDFVKLLKDSYGYDELLEACLFVVEVLPRSFLERLNKREGDRVVGLLEYKNPTLAKIFGYYFYKKDLGTYWSDKFGGDIKKAPINAWPIEIEEGFIKDELEKVDGYRIFHPYFKKWEGN